MWYKLFSQLVGQILLWIREPNICDWVRHLNQLPGKWEITPGAVLNTENQKSGKGGQHSSVWERRHPMHTDSEIIALPKFRPPTFAWGYGALVTEVIGNLSIDFGGLGIRPTWGRLSCSWAWDGLVQEGGRSGRKRGPSWRGHLATAACTRWLLGGHGAPCLQHRISFTRPLFIALGYLAHLLTEAGDSFFAWWQVSVALTRGWTGRPLLINQWNNSWKCWPPGVSVTQPSNPRCRGFALKGSFWLCGQQPSFSCPSLPLPGYSGKYREAYRAC